MSFLANLAIRNKLMLMLIFPILGLLYFSISGILTKYELRNKMDSFQSLSDIAVMSSSLIHEFQKERGMSAGYLGSKGGKFSAELRKQREHSDQKKSELLASLNNIDLEQFDSEFINLTDETKNHFSNLQNIRRNVDNFNISTSDEIKYYSEMISTMLSVISHMSKLAADAEMAAMITAYYNLLENKERAGQERAVLSNTFGANKFNPGMYEKFISLVTGQEIFKHLFLSYATNDAISFYQSKMGDSSVREVQRLREIAQAKAKEGDFGVDAGHWFNTITVKIDILKETEDKLSGNLIAAANNHLNVANMQLIIYFTLSILTITIGIALSIIVTRNIVIPINRIVDVSQKIADYDLTSDLLDLNSADEIGAMSQAIDKMKNRLTEMIIVISKNVDSLASAATEISSSSERLEAGAEEQANQTTQMTAAVEQMTVTIAENTKNTTTASELAEQANTFSKNGSDLANNASRGIDEIVESTQLTATNIAGLSEKAITIGQIINVINDIADQTNLLALNAAIEAARAGEQGRGFAVVADEVRKLAERTTQATEEVTETIKGIQTDVKTTNSQISESEVIVAKGKTLVDDTGGSLNEILGAVEVVQDMMRQIATASEQQSSAAYNISTNIEGIDNISKETLSGSREAKVAADSLSRQSEELKNIVESFKLA